MKPHVIRHKTIGGRRILLACHLKLYWWDHGQGLSVSVRLELYLGVCVIKEH
jgi:hypothetical protein